MFSKRFTTIRTQTNPSKSVGFDQRKSQKNSHKKWRYMRLWWSQTIARVSFYHCLGSFSWKGCEFLIGVPGGRGLWVLVQGGGGGGLRHFKPQECQPFSELQHNQGISRHKTQAAFRLGQALPQGLSLGA